MLINLSKLGISEEALTQAILSELGMTREQAVKALADKLGVKTAYADDGSAVISRDELLALQNDSRLLASVREAIRSIGLPS